MANTVDAALEFNKDTWEMAFSQIFRASVPSSTKYDLVWAYVGIGICHHKAIHTLARERLLASAFALLRPQIETAFRALWVESFATDEQVNSIRQKGEEPFPSFRKMAGELDSRYWDCGWFHNIASDWETLNGYTHSGLEQLGRQFRDDGSFGPNYPDELVINLLAISGYVSIGSLVLLCRGMDLNDKAEALEQWAYKHSFSRDGFAKKL